MNRPNMQNNIYFEETADLFCTDTDKTVTGHVMSFKDGVYLTVAIENKIVVNLQYNGQHGVYIGNMSGLEFQSKGPARIA